MVRLYVQLSDDTVHGRATDDASTTLATAKNIMAPFDLNAKSVYWSTRYRIQQLLAVQYSAFDRLVFIVGDAAHTHSPKAGMGLNISVQDAYNLSWKLAAVIRERAKPNILDTYEVERQPQAQKLLRFDRDFDTLFNSPLVSNTTEQYQMGILRAIDAESGDISGVAAEYSDRGSLTSSKCCRHLATKVRLGKRIPHGVLLNHSDGRAWNIHELLPSNGRWRICVFPGDIREHAPRYKYEELGKNSRRRHLCSEHLLCLKQTRIVCSRYSPYIRHPGMRSIF
jgi:phenol 2-monooxygenase